MENVEQKTDSVNFKDSLFKSIKTAWFCLRTVEYGSIMISIFSLEFKSFNRIFGKPDESLGRKAKGPVKWQPVA